MMCGCDGGWNGGDGSLKSIFKQIRAVKHGGKFRSLLTKVYEGGEQRADLDRLPWFEQTMLTCGGEFGYKFLCRTIST